MTSRSGRLLIGESVVLTEFELELIDELTHAGLATERTRVRKRPAAGASAIARRVAPRARSWVGLPSQPHPATNPSPASNPSSAH